jgi:hypothetical protein
VKGLLKFVQFLLEIGIPVGILLAVWAIVLDQIDTYRWRKAKRSA